MLQLLGESDILWQRDLGTWPRKSDHQCSCGFELMFMFMFMISELTRPEMSCTPKDGNISGTVRH